jgi:hypothetical protein
MLQKKRTSKTWLLILAIFSTIVITSYVEPEKKYKFEMTLDEINATVSCLEQSNAPASTANAIIKIIASQVNPQLQADKKIADSLNKKNHP